MSDIDPSVIVDNQRVDKRDLREQFTIAKNEITVLEQRSSALVPETYASMYDRTTVTSADIQHMLDDAATHSLPVMFPNIYTLDDRIEFHALTQIIGNMRFLLDTSLTDESGLGYISNDERDVDIRFGENCMGQKIYATCAGGTALNTYQIHIGSGTELDVVAIKATVQRTGGGVLLEGQDVRIGEFRAINYDRPFYVHCEDEDAPATGFYLGSMDIKSFLRAVRLDNIDSPFFGKTFIRGRSPNALIGHVPGTNGILLQGVSNSVFNNVYIADSGEHSIRVGSSSFDGSTQANQTVNVRMGTLHLVRPGCAPIKINPGMNGELCEGFHIDRLICEDVGDTANGGTLAPNMRVMRISHARNVTVGSIEFITNGQASGAQAVLGLNDVIGLSIGSIKGNVPLAGIIIDDTQDNDDDVDGEGGDNNVGPVENVTIGSCDFTPTSAGHIINISSTKPVITSGTYDNGTGVIVLTMLARMATMNGVTSVTLEALTGTGAFASLNGAWPVTDFTASTLVPEVAATITLAATPGLGVSTITGGNLTKSIFGVGNINIELKADYVNVGVLNIGASVPITDPIRIKAEIRGGATKPAITLGDVAVQAPYVYRDIRWDAKRWFGYATVSARGVSPLEIAGIAGSTADVPAGNASLFLTSYDVAAGENNIGAVAAFSRLGSTRNGAMFGVIQTGPSDINTGAGIWAGGTSLSDALSQYMILTHLGGLRGTIPFYADDAAALLGGLEVGDAYFVTATGLLKRIL